MHQGSLSRFQRHIRRQLAIRREMPLPDTAALDNPFVTRINELGKIVIRNNAGGQIRPAPGHHTSGNTHN